MEKTHGGSGFGCASSQESPLSAQRKTEREASPSGSSLLPRQYGTPGTGNQPGPSGPILYTNEKYIGSVLLQKTYVQDLFSRKQCKNMGEKLRYLYQYAHPAIISQELFEKVNGKLQGMQD